MDCKIITKKLAFPTLQSRPRVLSPPSTVECIFPFNKRDPPIHSITSVIGNASNPNLTFKVHPFRRLGHGFLNDVFVSNTHIE